MPHLLEFCTFFITFPQLTDEDALYNALTPVTAAPAAFVATAFLSIPISSALSFAHTAP